MVLLVAGAVLAAGLYYLTRPAQLSRIVSRVIELTTPLEAAVDSARLSLKGDLILEGVRLRIPDQPEHAAQLFSAEQIQLHASMTDLLSGTLAADSITLVRPTIYLVEDLATGRFNIQNIPASDGTGELPRFLPQVVLQDGRIRFGEIADDRYAALGEIRLDGTLTESQRQSGQYDVILRQASGDGVKDAADEDSPVLRGTLQTGLHLSVRAILENFSLERPHRNLLPRRLREWWDRLSPQGSLSTVEVSYGTDPSVGLHAILAIDHGALRLPYGDFAPRMSDVSGRFVVQGEQITIDHLTGFVAGIRYAIDGSITGFESDAAFDLTARTAPFTIAENPYYLALLPPTIRNHYTRFSPSGEFVATATLRRPRRGGEVQYSGELDVRNARGRYYKFPFPLDNVNGTIRFSDQQVEIVGLQGHGLSGGTLHIRGTITPPGDGAAVQMRITATDVPVDQRLTDAMKPSHRKVVNTFLNRQQYQQLVEQGLIRPRKSPTQDVTSAGPHDAHPFDLGGLLSAVVEIDRPYGEDADYRVTTTVDTTGASMLVKAWPYPLTSAGGTLIIGPDAVELHDVQARGLTGGRGVIDGIIERPNKTELVPRIELRDVHLPVDDLLLASLPQPQDQWIRDLDVRGAVVGTGRVFRDDDGELDFTLDAEFDGGSADPFPVVAKADDDADAEDASVDTRLHNITGSFVVRRTNLTLQKLTGDNSDASVSISGGLDWSQDPTAIDLRLSASGLAIRPGLLALLPSDHAARLRLESLIHQYRPVGRFDGELDYRSRTRDRLEAFTVTLKPHDLAFDWGGQRAAFDAIDGTVVIRPGMVELNDLAVDLDHGAATLAGRVPFGDSRDGQPWALRIGATGTEFDANSRVFLPDGVVRTIDGLEVGGQFNLAGSLVGGEGGQTSFSGRIELTDATADVGVPVTDLRGVLTVDAARMPDDPWPDIDLRLEADSLRIANRLVEPFTLQLATGQPGTLTIQHMLGSVYNGTLVGEGAIELGDPGRYQFDFTLSNVDVNPVIEAGNLPQGQPQQATGGGSLSASLAIEAVPGQPASRIGRGGLEVHDAQLFEKPFTMAVLHAANLSLPANDAFDRASARYLLDGDLIQFDSLSLESPTVAIVGAGQMTYPQQQLDLALVTRNPGGPNLGAFTDMLNVFKDELIAIQVTGPLDAPNARLVPFEGLRTSWQRIFGAPDVRVTPFTNSTRTGD